MMLGLVLFLKQGDVYVKACYSFLFILFFSCFSIFEIRMVSKLLRASDNCDVVALEIS